MSFLPEETASPGRRQGVTSGFPRPPKWAWPTFGSITRQSSYWPTISKHLASTRRSWKASMWTCSPGPGTKMPKPRFIGSSMGAGARAMRPKAGLVQRRDALLELRYELTPQEIARYQELGREAADAMESVAARVARKESEVQIVAGLTPLSWSGDLSRSSPWWPPTGGFKGTAIPCPPAPRSSVRRCW